jgi:hypothetical protein
VGRERESRGGGEIPYSFTVSIVIVSLMQTSREISYRVREKPRIDVFCFCFGLRFKVFEIKIRFKVFESS